MDQATDTRHTGDWRSTARHYAGNGLRFVSGGAARLTARLQWLAYRLAVSDVGAVAAEYTFLIAFISILAAIGMVLMGGDLRDYFQAMATALNNASQPTPDPFAT